MKNTIIYFIASCFILVCIGCKKEVISNPDDPFVPTTPVDTIIPIGEEKYLNLDSDYIFDQDKLPTFELTLSEEALQFLNADPAAEEYVEGSLTFEGETISPVGIRYKGSIGGFVGCVSGSDWSNPSGSKTCTKLSMKIKFNWVNSDDTFYGLKKLQLHSMNLDDSQMRDRLGYALFREMGVKAPRCIHARLVINGEYSGIYSLVEQIDGRFTRLNFDDGSGNLYKEVWPLRSNGQATSEIAYRQSLKTNEDEDPSVELIRNFGEFLSVADQQGAKQVVEDYMDIENIISYAAVDRTLRVDDGPFHWYCGGGSCTNHNYYWYEDPSASKLHLIPWDLDNAFENIIFNQNPVTPIKDEWGQTSNNCLPFSYGAFGFTQWSAACDKLTETWTSYDNLYTEKLQAFKSGPLSKNNVDQKINAWAEQIEQATKDADLLHSDAISISRWESGMNQLFEQVNHARNN